ncbi:hypothetical protein [Halorubellus sp. PRR65]|nr:hypothetical protein [Halorubellus sp. PRR65]
MKESTSFDFLPPYGEPEVTTKGKDANEVGLVVGLAALGVAAYLASK